MLAGSRDAPTTATVRGVISGRIEATVASACLRSAAAIDSDVGFSDSSTVTQPRSVFDRISNPDSWNTSSMPAFSGSTIASKRRKPWAAASVANRSRRSVPSPLP